MSIETWRSDTPLHEHYSYLNTAAACAPPRQVVEAMTDYLVKTSTLGPYLPKFRRETYDTLDAIRYRTAQFIHADKEEISFTKNGTEALNFIAFGWKFKPEEEVLIADFEFHSNYTPWLKLENERKIKLIVVQTDKTGIVTLEQIKANVTPNTKLISLSHLPNASGALQPIEEICNWAHSNGILTLINAAETVGLYPLDMQKIPCDFLATCGRKYLRGPEGSGFLFIRKKWISEITPTLIGWGGTDWDFETNQIQFLPIARRVEAGCPIVPSILGMGAALDYASDIGIQEIYKRVKSLTDYTVKQLSTLSEIEIYGPERLEDRLAIIPFNIKGINPDEITRYLEEYQIIIESGTFMANTLLKQYGITKMARISPHYFNTEEEIDRVVVLLQDLIKKENP